MNNIIFMPVKHNNPPLFITVMQKTDYIFVEIWSLYTYFNIHKHEWKKLDRPYQICFIS